MTTPNQRQIFKDLTRLNSAIFIHQVSFNETDLQKCFHILNFCIDFILLKSYN